MSFASGGRRGFWLFDRFASDIQIDHAPSAAKSLFLARLAIDRRVEVLRAGLAREHHQLFGAAAVGIDVCYDLQACLLKFAQAEVRHLNAVPLLRCENNAGALEIFPGETDSFIEFILSYHGSFTSLRSLWRDKNPRLKLYNV